MVMAWAVSATTLNEYRKIEKDPALERRFQQVLVQEPSIEDDEEIITVEPFFEEDADI